MSKKAKGYGVLKGSKVYHDVVRHRRGPTYDTPCGLVVFSRELTSTPPKDRRFCKRCAATRKARAK